MGKEYIPLFLDFNDTTQDLTDEECGRLVRAMVDYANNGDYEARITGAERIAFRFMKGLIDRNKAISEIRAQSGAKRNNKEQREAKESKTEQDETKQPTETEVKEETKKEKKKFTPPSLEEVEQYCKERKNGINAQYFIDYYSARGWELKPGQKVKDWRACIRTWEERNKKPNTAQTSNVKSLPAQSYSQRKYDEPPRTLEQLMAEQGAI